MTNCYFHIFFCHFTLKPARSIWRKPRKSLNPWKFSFPSQTDHCPPIITFAHGVSRNLEFFFFGGGGGVSKKSDLPPIHGFVVQSESTKLVEIFKSWRFVIFLYWRLKCTALIRQVTNNKCLRGIATRISQSLSVLVSCDPCCYLSSEKLTWSSFLLVL